jgi:signal transduction histidine kinase
MRVATRLNLTVLPAVVGLVLVVLLAYFGEYHRQAPELLVALASVAAVGSALLAWRNTRILSRRVGELAHGFRELGLAAPLPSVSSLDEFDELDAVRQSVMRLAAAKAALRQSAEAQMAAMEQRLSQQEQLLREVTREVTTRLEEARLALHILQSNPFGELNENQEELIAAARTAADAADAELRTLGRLAAAASIVAQRPAEPTMVRALLEPPLAMAFGGAQDAAASSTITLPDDLPRVQAEAISAQDALSTLLRDAATAVAPGERLQLTAQAMAEAVTLTIQPAPEWEDAPPLRAQLAIRLIEAQGGSVQRDAAALRVRLPVATRSMGDRSAIVSDYS